METKTTSKDKSLITLLFSIVGGAHTQVSKIESGKKAAPAKTPVKELSITNY